MTSGFLISVVRSWHFLAHYAPAILNAITFLERKKCKIIAGTSDFYGMNHYTSLQISDACSAVGTSWQNDVSASSSQPDSWPPTASFWFRVHPEGFRRALKFIHDEYNAPLIYVTENGYSDKGGLEDDGRISFYNVRF